MKRISFALITALFCASFFISCTDFGNDHDTSFSYHDSPHYYSRKARFDRNKTRDVEQFMDRAIGSDSRMSFVNTKIDGRIALDDRTILYIKKYPGRLYIKLDKDENSYDAYQKIKSMCQQLKDVVIKKHQ